MGKPLLVVSMEERPVTCHVIAWAGKRHPNTHTHKHAKSMPETIKWESCSCPSSVAALGRLALVPSLGNTEAGPEDVGVGDLTLRMYKRENLPRPLLLEQWVKRQRRRAHPSGEDRDSRPREESCNYPGPEPPYL